MIGTTAPATLQLSVLLTLLGAVAAQQTLSGLVEGPNGQPVAGARVVFFDDQPPAFATVPSPARSPACEGHTDAAGRFRLRRQDAPFRSGAVWIDNATGLCAFLPAVAAAGPLLVRLDTGSAVQTTPADDGALQALALVADGPPCHLGTLARPAVLPPGRFRLLQRAACGWNEHAVSIRAGTACVLPAAQPTRQFVSLPRDFAGEVRLAGWPTAAIALRAQDGRIAVPPGPPPRSLLFAETIGEATLFREVVCRGDTGGALDPRDANLRPVRIRAQRPVTEAPLAQAVEPAGSGWLVRAACRLRRAGDEFVGDLPLPATAAAVLVTSPGFAPSWQALESGDEPTSLAAGRTLMVQIEPEAASETAPAIVELTHREAAWLTLTARSDALGRVSFADLPAGVAQLRVWRTGSRLQQSDVDLAGADTTVRIRLQPGSALHGAVVLAGGAAAAHAEVVLRDPTGTLHMETLRTFADQQGRFSFRGLAADGPLTLSASLERDGQTWSAQRHGIQPGDEVELQLQLEDPAPPGVRRDR